MADTMNLKEVSEYLELSQDDIILLLEVGELDGEQHGQEWHLTRASVVAYKARQIARENATYSIEDRE